MPRWSKTIRSRVEAIGPSSSANVSENGSADCPGPPARAMIALCASPTGARWRRRASVIVPGTAPLGSNGTVRWPQAKSLLFAHGVNAISAAADGANWEQARLRSQAHAVNRPTSLCTRGCINRNLLVVAAWTCRLPRVARARVWPMASARETVDAPAAPPAIGPYSHAVRAGDLLFCSGQIPLDPHTGELIGGSAGEQARRCLENLQAVCDAAGTTLDHAVGMTIYMTDLSAFAGVNGGY